MSNVAVDALDIIDAQIAWRERKAMDEAAKRR